MKYIISATCLCLAAVSFNANAVVLNTLNGIDYEWLELTETSFRDRFDVEAELTDVNSPLYGYEYASRELVEDLLLSYSFWGGLDGNHGDSSVVAGMDRFMDDFGRITNEEYGYTLTTVDGFTVTQYSQSLSYAMFGLPGECGGLDYTCVARALVRYDEAGVAVAALQESRYGWDSTRNDPSNGHNSTISWDAGSFLVRAVPVPPAVWLFGSGLIGLIGVARRKKA